MNHNSESEEEFPKEEIKKSPEDLSDKKDL